MSTTRIAVEAVRHGEIEATALDGSEVALPAASSAEQLAAAVHHADVDRALTTGLTATAQEVVDHVAEQERESKAWAAPLADLTASLVEVDHVLALADHLLAVPGSLLAGKAPNSRENEGRFIIHGREGAVGRLAAARLPAPPLSDEDAYRGAAARLGAARQRALDAAAVLVAGGEVLRAEARAMQVLFNELGKLQRRWRLALSDDRLVFDLGSGGGRPDLLHILRRKDGGVFLTSALTDSSLAHALDGYSVKTIHAGGVMPSAALLEQLQRELGAYEIFTGLVHEAATFHNTVRSSRRTETFSVVHVAATSLVINVVPEEPDIVFRFEQETARETGNLVIEGLSPTDTRLVHIVLREQVCVQHRLGIRAQVLLHVVRYILFLGLRRRLSAQLDVLAEKYAASIRWSLSRYVTAEAAVDIRQRRRPNKPAYRLTLRGNVIKADAVDRDHGTVATVAETEAVALVEIYLRRTA